MRREGAVNPSEYWRLESTPECDSGVRPPEGALSDGVTDYCVGHCGFVVSYPSGRWFEDGRPQMDDHLRTVHPARFAEIDRIRRGSAD